MSLRFFIGVGAQKCSLNQSPSVILLLSRIHRYFSCLHLLPDRTVEVTVVTYACQEFRGQVVPQIEAVHNLRKVRMYLNVLSLRSTS